MRKITTAISVILGTLLGSIAQAQVATGGVSTMAQTSLASESFSFRPFVGYMNYQDPSFNNYSELAVGALGDVNGLKFYNPMGWDSNLFLVGAESGLVFSHLSVSGSNFLFLPIDLKVGYMVTSNLRVSLHGGGNLTYRSTANSMRLSSTPQGPGASFDLFPNFGGDIEYAFARDYAVSVRPDVTFTSGNNFFTGTVALVVPFATT